MYTIEDLTTIAAETTVTVRDHIAEVRGAMDDFEDPNAEHYSDTTINAVTMAFLEQIMIISEFDSYGDEEMRHINHNDVEAFIRHGLTPRVAGILHGALLTDHDIALIYDTLPRLYAHRGFNLPEIAWEE